MPPKTSLQSVKDSPIKPDHPSSTLPTDDLNLERETLGKPWRDALKGALQSPTFQQLKAFLASERQRDQKVYPAESDVYTWSRHPSRGPQGVRVVLVGQDPYHGPNQAHGLSFSVQPGVSIPPSLRNIYKEIAAEYPAGSPRDGHTDSAPMLDVQDPLDQRGGFKPPNHGSLVGWAEQGVLLLNACLTVRASQAGSHHGKGWEPFTQTVLQVLGQEAKRAHPPLGPPLESIAVRPSAAAGTPSSQEEREIQFEAQQHGDVRGVPVEEQNVEGQQQTEGKLFKRVTNETRMGNGQGKRKASALTPPASGSRTLEQMFARSKRAKHRAATTRVHASNRDADPSPNPSTSTTTTGPVQPREPVPSGSGSQFQAGTGSLPDRAVTVPAFPLAPPTHDDARVLPPTEPANCGSGQEDVCRGIVFLAWGAQASKILTQAGITDDTPNVLILRSAHPSPLSAHRGFLGNGHFRQANNWLISRYGSQGAIDWSYLPAKPPDAPGFDLAE